MIQEQNPQTPTDSAPEDTGSLDAAARAFEQREEAEATPEADAEVSEADPDAEASDGDSDEDTEQELQEVTVEGVTLSLPKDQAEAIHKGVLRQNEFSRNMNEIGQTRKVLESRLQVAEAIEGAVELITTHATSVKLIEQQMRQLEAIDFNRLQAEDPNRAALIGYQYMSAKSALSEAKANLEKARADAKTGRDHLIESERAEMFAAISKALPKWSNQDGQDLTEWHIARGGTEQSLKQMTDPMRVVDMYKAMKFDALQKSKTDLKAKVKDAPPVLKPGVRQATKNAADDAMTQLRKFKTRDAAEVAFLARMK